MPTEPTRLDARGLRALAHPLRLDLLDLLFSEGPLTATRCAERLGVSPKVCSYHLQLLGSYGLIEETGTGKGRARPWRIAPHAVSYVHSEDGDAATDRAADQFARTMLAREARTVENFISGRDRLPEQWRNVATMVHRPARLTPAKLAALGEELGAVLDRYCPPPDGAAPPDDADDPDARTVSIAIYAVPTDTD